MRLFCLAHRTHGGIYLRAYWLSVFAAEVVGVEVDVDSEHVGAASAACKAHPTLPQ